MDLLKDDSVTAASSDLGAIESFWFELTRHGKPPAEAVTWPLVEHALTLADQGRIDVAALCVIEMSHQFDMTLEQFFDIAIRLHQRNPAFGKTKLFTHYIKNGGVRREAFELEITRCYQVEDFDGAITLFKKSKKWLSWKSLAASALFLVANAYLIRGELDECFVILSFIVEAHPEDQSSKNNMVYLAANLEYQPAVQYFLDSVDEISKSFNNRPVNSDSTKVPFIVDLNVKEKTDIISALYEHGLCHVKNAIDVDVAKEIHDHVARYEEILDVPIGFDPFITARCAALLRFDATAVVDALLPAPGALDETHCVVRKVDPGAAHSFTPFHQDATAFHKAVVNIWTPLTPAGGDYPTIELVKRRLSFAEATVHTSDDYNLVKIDDAEILKKYHGDLYEPTDVKPGECIIFLGTTIHRSTNLQAATKPRYNLEIRWS
jgi:ectoine hydroxylase-related dioxygenase (phytanoyl-CoA dioxygenase family)